MKFKKIIKLFEDGNVCVTGLRGRGKDMLLSNVATRRKKPYISNINYGGKYHELNLNELDVGKNSYKNFIENKINYYKYPYPDNTDIYISDVGIYFPAQYCNELNRQFPNVPIFMALSRQLGACNVHINVQNLNRAWDKIREQSDIYIMCNKCIVLFGKIIIQSIRIYDRYESCVNRQEPFKAPFSLKGETRAIIKLQKAQFRATHGMIKNKMLIYINKSNYNTRFFKEILEKGTKKA